jgi:hypothetical protein
VANTVAGGGGGGGGVYGGGGGEASAAGNGGGGGGGGANYYTGTNVITLKGTLATPPNTLDADYPSNIAGGGASGASGQVGAVLIYY